MDTKAWLRQTLAGTTIVGMTGRHYSVADVTDDGLVVGCDDSSGCHVVTVREIAMTVRLWARLERAPNPLELRQANISAEHALFLAPLVRMLRSVPQIRIWSAPVAPETPAMTAMTAELFALSLAEAAD